MLNTKQNEIADLFRHACNLHIFANRPELDLGPLQAQPFGDTFSVRIAIDESGCVTIEHLPKGDSDIKSDLPEGMFYCHLSDDLPEFQLYILPGANSFVFDAKMDAIYNAQRERTPLIDYANSQNKVVVIDGHVQSKEQLDANPPLLAKYYAPLTVAETWDVPKEALTL